jgi:hypothetical protein
MLALGGIVEVALPNNWHPSGEFTARHVANRAPGTAGMACPVAHTIEDS